MLLPDARDDPMKLKKFCFFFAASAPPGPRGVLNFEIGLPLLSGRLMFIPGMEGNPLLFLSIKLLEVI